MNDRQGHDEPGRPVQAVETSCAILDAIREFEGAGVTELADHLGITKGTVHNHLATLRKQEFVRKDDDAYNVSLRFVDFGEYAKDSIPIHDIAKTETRTLADDTDEVASFMIEEHGMGVYLHKETGTNAVQTYSYVGDRNYLHCSALGKAILAWLPRERVRWIVDRHGLPERTENTVTTEEQLFTELDEARERGYTLDDEEAIAGLRCVAAPVIGHDGTLHGSVSVSGPTNRFTGEYFREELPDTVTGAANVMKINTAQL